MGQMIRFSRDGVFNDTTYHAGQTVTLPDDVARQVVISGYGVRGDEHKTPRAPEVTTESDLPPDTLALMRVERETHARLARLNALAVARVQDATTFTEPWANTTAWTGTGTVAAGRVVSAGSLQRPAPTVARWVARTTLHTTGQAGQSAYFGVILQGGAQYLGIGQGSASTAAAVARSAGVSAAAVVIPRSLPTLAAGDYLCTVVKDETHLSLSIQPVGGGQAIYGCRILLSALPAAISNVYVTATDPATGGMNFGPVVIHNELAVPPAASRVVGGVTLFGATKPLMFLRSDPATGIGHVVSIPGDLDARVPAPLVFFAHQSLTGVGMTPWTETRMANVVAALEAAGYVIVSSDGGPGLTAGGTQDKYGNQASLDDAEAALTWAREHIASGAVFLLGASMGNYLSMNLLAQRRVGGIAAAASISGGTDLLPALSDTTYGPKLLAAYGATDAADFAVKAAGFNPAARHPREFRGVPLRFYYGTADTVGPRTAQVDPFVAKVAPYVPEVQVIGGNVGHLDTSLYQGSNLVAFFNKYR